MSREETNTIALDDIVQKNISKNIRALHNFFSSNNFITEKGDPKTNLICVSERKTYNLPASKADEFFTIYDACRTEGMSLHWSERQETELLSHSGIMIDFDVYQLSKEPLIAISHFEALTRHLSRIIRAFVDFDEYAISDAFTFHIFFIRKPAVVLDTVESEGKPAVYKDGFHVLIPEIQVSKGLKKYINQELMTKEVMKTVFKGVPSIDTSKVLDMMSSSVPVYFFGGSKPGKPAYVLEYASEVTILTDEEDISRLSLNVKDISSGAIKMSLKGEPIPINLAYELSLSTYMISLNSNPTWLKKRQLEPRAGIAQKVQLITEKGSGNFDADELAREEEDISLIGLNNPRAKNLLDTLMLLDIKYAQNYELWFKVMCAIAHTGISDDYRNIAREFSKRSPDSWSSAEFERVWAEAISNKFNRDPVTIRSIQHWVRETSPSLLAELEKNDYQNTLRRVSYENEGRIEQTHAAKLAHIMCGNKFVCDVSFNDKTGRVGYCWYEFVTPGQSMKKGEVYKYRKELEPDNIHLFISEHLPKVYTQVRDTIKDRKENAVSKEEMKYWKFVEQNMRLYQSKLGNDTFQGGIIRQAQYRFRQRGFCDDLDSYGDIIGVGNGILKLGEVPQLIKGFHEYKISKYTETNYVPYDPENPKVKILLQAFHDIFPEEDVFNYMMLHASTGLDGKESACILTLLTGGGQNGKSFFLKMIHNTLGNQYCASGKAALITAPMERSENANSAQMQQKDKNYFYIDEFNKTETLNTQRVKAMVSPGWQSGRDLHTRQANFKNTSNTICASNFDFIVETTDHGTWRRVIYYKNKMKFCAKPNPANPFERMVNAKFIDEYANDPEFHEAMMSIMTNFNGILRREYDGDLKNVYSPTLERETEAFRNRQDALNKFITQMLVKSPEAEPTSIISLATRYIEWYSKTIKVTAQSITDVTSQFENSRVASSIEHRIGGILYLVGHRLKAAAEDSLMDGEESLLVSAPADDPVAPMVQIAPPTRDLMSMNEYDNILECL